MANHVDLKSLERKAYTSYHQEGLIDIFVGLAIINLGICLLPTVIEYAYLGMGSVAVVWFFGYLGAKRTLTVPRMGYVEFSKQRQGRLMFLLSFLLILNLLLVLIPVLGLLTSEVMHFLRVNVLAIIGLAAGGLFALFAFVTNIHRLYGYSSIALVLFVLAHVFSAQLSIPTILLGLVMTATGFALLYTFLRKYPKGEPSEEIDDSWET